jgi:arylsulfatase A-like enzyme
VTEGVANQPAHRAIRNRRYKLIFEPGRPAGQEQGADPYALFDTVEDPDETRDLLADPARSARTQRAFHALSAALPEAVPHFEESPADWVPMDRELKARLEALGYGAGADAETSWVPDPGEGD